MRRGSARSETLPKSKRGQAVNETKMTVDTIKRFPFSPELQSQFAKLSGDWNPMHMNAVEARRTQSGRPVVHGIHTVLRTLDVFAEGSADLPLPLKLTVRFPAPVYVDDTIEVHRVDAADRQLRLQARVDGTNTAELRVVLGNAARTEGRFDGYRVDVQIACKELSLAEMKGRAGTVLPASTLEEIEREFPNASRWLGAECVAALLCLSRLVGMECPGLHSLFSGFTLEFSTESTPASMQYQVARVDDHYRLLNIDVQGLGVRGSVEAFARHPPIAQPSINELSALVKPKEFAGQRALILGGSRGLGELTAKLIAAGGGHPFITYAVGRRDAERIIVEISQWGGNCDALQYDVRMPAAPQLRSLAAPVSQVYYYASGQIFGRKTKEFQPAIFDDFLQFYVRAFYDLCAALRESTQQGISVFYPSSVAVQERPRNMTEYAMAKAAGELLCADLNRFWPTMHITMVRLPRLLTDQTSTVASVENANSVDTILPIIREVQGFRF
jgi:acyl dehydratase/NAD(P)-dependent dehydrogenase (short-subunit alcohol dehydrogenase family)